MLIDLNDQIQLFQNTLISYKGEVCYVSNIGQDSVLLERLVDGKELIVKFDFSLFKSISARIGYMNTGCTSLYATRRPLRQYQQGWNSQLFSFLSNAGDETSMAERNKALHDINSMNSRTWLNAINGIYPTFQEALEKVKQHHFSVAFDKQFAVSKHNEVFYRSAQVGRVDGDTVEQIVWDAGKEYLASVLKELTHESLRDSCSKEVQEA